MVISTHTFAARPRLLDPRAVFFVMQISFRALICLVHFSFLPVIRYPGINSENEIITTTRFRAISIYLSQKKRLKLRLFHNALAQHGQAFRALFYLPIFARFSPFWGHILKYLGIAFAVNIFHVAVLQFSNWRA